MDTVWLAGITRVWLDPPVVASSGHQGCWLALDPPVVASRGHQGLVGYSVASSDHQGLVGYSVASSGSPGFGWIQCG